MVTLFILALCLASACARLPPASVGSYFAGRSADIIIQSQNSRQDSVVFFKGDQFSTTELNKLEDTQFADIFAHVMGTSPFHLHADRTGFPTTSLFNKPKAAAVIVIDSVGAEILRSYPTLSLLQNAHTTALVTQSTPANTHSILANLATGSLPSTHGIVGSSWRKPVTGELVSAYSVDGQSFAANIADILLQESSGRSLSISASASASFASALGVHPELVSENLGWRAHAYSLTEDGFDTRYTDPSVDQVFQVSMKALAIEDLNVLAGNVQVTFSKDNTEDFTLLAEIAYVRTLIAKLQSDSLSAQINDNFPDLYSFVFSSLKGIQTRYGADSATFTAALAIVDRTAENLISALNALYDQRVAVAVVAMNARDTTSEALKQIIFKKVSNILYSEEDFAKYFPVVYVRTNDFNGFTRDAMCSNLQTIVESGNVLCLSPFLATRSLRNTNNLAAPTNSTYDIDHVWAFWLNFFVTLIIASFIGWGVYCLTFVGIEASKDTLLFRAPGRSLAN